MPVVVIHAGADPASVVLPRQDTGTQSGTSTKEPPNPILPVPKEMAWGFGSFVVLFVLLRLWLFPKLKNGMLARNAKVKADLDDSERIRREAADDVAQYEAAVAAARAEAAHLIELARQEVDADRTVKVAAANARVAELRAAATAELDHARLAALGQVEDIVLEVAATAAEQILHRAVDREAARPTVAAVVREGAAV